MTQRLRFAKLLAIPFFMKSQENLTDSKTWDVSKTESEFHPIVYNSNTSEGTWMNLNASPDGETNLYNTWYGSYAVPISGGNPLFLQLHLPFHEKSLPISLFTNVSTHLKTVLNT